MASLAILGNLTFPNSPNGANTAVLIGAPTRTIDDTDGLAVAYNEKAEFELKVAALGVKAVNFGSISNGKFVYIGVTQAVTYKINGGSEEFSIGAGGFKMEVLGAITAIEITAGASDADVYILILGD